MTHKQCSNVSKQKVSILNKRCSFKLSIHQRILKQKCITVTTKILSSTIKYFFALILIGQYSSDRKRSEREREREREGEEEEEEGGGGY